VDLSVVGVIAAVVFVVVVGIIFGVVTLKPESGDQ